MTSTHESKSSTARTMIEQFAAARKAKAPIVAIRTPDPASTIRIIKEHWSGDPLAQWNMISGLTHINEACREHCDKANTIMGLDGEPHVDPPQATGNPVEALRRGAHYLPDRSIMLFHNLHMYMDKDGGELQKPVIQATWNLRDTFKLSNRTLVMLVPDITIPAEIKHDVLVIDEPLPTDEQLASIIIQGVKSLGMTKPKPALLDKLVDAVAGLAAFNAEQVIMMSSDPETGSIDVENAWYHKVQIIEQDPSLKVFRGGTTFDQIAGHDNLKSLLTMVVSGKKKPRLIVFIEEIDVLAAADTESSGTTMDQVKQLCVKMQDNGWDGIILYGFPGTAKSEMAKALGNEAGCATIQADFGGMKSKWVGSSEAKFRSFIKIVEAMSNHSDRVFFVATCNRVSNLRPEFKRRFHKGIAFYDLPERTEKDNIWKIKLKQYDLDARMAKPNDEGWTGAEIDVCCANAAEFGITLIEAAKFMTVVSHGMGDEEVKAIRQHASGKFINSHQAGVYTWNQPKKANLLDKLMGA